MFKKVIVGISGGVDSAVAALLLKSKGMNVTGVFMRNWDVVNEAGECQVEQELQDAKWVCNNLKIPLIDVNFVKDYWIDVFSNLVESYEIDAIATGHYAHSSFGPFLEYYQPNKNVALLRAKDFYKDQTFFLSQISQEALRRTMFPIGAFLKSDVKKIAKEAGLDVVLNKKESAGICFIGRRNFKEFIREYVEDKPGNFIDFETGTCIGRHKGIHQWTLGQGCRIGGTLMPYYIYQKDLENNNIYVVAGNNHPALFSEFFSTAEVHWINKEPEQLKNSKSVFNCNFRFQHRRPLVPCTVFKTIENKLFIHVEEPQRAVTAGQYAVLYCGQECLGSAEILNTGPSFYFIGKDAKEYVQIDI
ncbi:mitochondrial tRNA-specific 2-thiouridylase 1 isoform X2 [Phymastichus coffea]|uniref:mitochondrial tRNA-specific 2-thiouridylase 1 isoform X2 n=1 Tax=Phymastichus coffea TaxID=108790 RepID=UPI00273B9EA0|nr:mitochondrial tRNA-specific 2-thiouridylase 1 isoform X2 [Phymastichus coffea]